MSHSFLHREDVRDPLYRFLRDLPKGKVTPQIVVKHVTEVIFPAVDIQGTKPISLRTASRWLIKMGWTYSRTKKGVYFDGHERDDVRKYRDEEFLLKMVEFEKRMVQYSGIDMKCTGPMLRPGETELNPMSLASIITTALKPCGECLC